MKTIMLDYNFRDLKEILVGKNGGIDLRFNNYPYADLSVETKQWETIQEFLNWYAGNLYLTEE